MTREGGQQRWKSGSRVEEGKGWGGGGKGWVRMVEGESKEESVCERELITLTGVVCFPPLYVVALYLEGVAHGRRAEGGARWFCVVVHAVRVWLGVEAGRGVGAVTQTHHLP